MTDTTINLNDHRDKSDRKSTRRRLRQVRELLCDQEDRPKSQDKIEELLLSVPAETWPEAGAQALYLIKVLAISSQTTSVRRQLLIEQTVNALETLCAKDV